MRYVLRNKQNGEFYSAPGWNETWTTDLDKALIYQTKGAPRRSMYGIGVPGYTHQELWKLPKKRKTELVAKAFDARFEILEVIITLL